MAWVEPLAAIMLVRMRRIAAGGRPAPVASLRMAPEADPRFEQAMDKLMLQVDKDNVLAAAAVFQRHARKLESYLTASTISREMGACGGDPVSADTLKMESFAGKIDELFRVHWDHQQELQAVADRLFEAARKYGHTDDDMSAIMNSRWATW